MHPRPVVLVTGAARRLGRAIALELAHAGHDIALHCRHSLAEAQATAQALHDAGAQAEILAADLADAAACEALVPRALERFGRLDAVVNNASRFDYDDVAGFDAASLVAHVQANTAPAIVLARALHAHLAARDAHGAVVNLLDQRLANPNVDYLSYTLSKAALAAAGDVLALALAPRVRVVGVAPGLVLGSALIDAQRVERLRARSLLRRLASEADVARMVRTAIEVPSLTGTTLYVDAGQHLQRTARDFPFQDDDDDSPDPR